MGIGLETIMETEIEQEECDAKWNRMRCEVEQNAMRSGTECDAKWNRMGFGVWGLEQGLGMGNMKQTNIGNIKHVGEWDQERGYERISRNDKAGIMG